MSSEEYVNQIEVLMETQYNHLEIFIGILSFAVVIVGILQWKLSDRQVERIKNEVEHKIREEYKAEIDDSFQQSHKIIIESQRVAVFTAIELLLMADVRLNGIPYKISNLLSTVPKLNEIFFKEATVLLDTVEYLLKHKDIVFSGDEHLNNLIGVEGLVDFIESRSPLDFLKANKIKIYQTKIEVMQSRKKYEIDHQE